jgi:monomeric sarcosine oxidase
MSETIPGAVDVAIVGGGIMGTSTAYHLTERTDLDVVLLEKRSIAAGSTGKSSGVVRFNYGDVRVYSEMAVRAHAFWTEAADHLGRDVGFVQNGLVYFGRDDADHGEKAGYEILRDLGVEVELADPSRLRELLPHVTVSDYDYGVYSPTAGFADPHAATQAFYESAKRNGLRVETGVEVTGFAGDDRRVTGVETTAGTVEADRVVSAAGPWTRRLLATAGVDVPVTPSREQLLVLDPPDDFFDAYPYPFPTVSSKAPGHIYVKPDPVGKVLVGGHHRGTDCDPDAYDETADMDYVTWAIDELEHRVPSLVDADLVNGYAGVYSNTPDKDFVIDEPVENLVCLAGFSGHGFKHAPVIGEVAADLVVDGETGVVDLSRFSLDRFGARVPSRDSL